LVCNIWNIILQLVNESNLSIPTHYVDYFIVLIYNEHISNILCHLYFLVEHCEVQDCNRQFYRCFRIYQ